MRRRQKRPTESGLNIGEEPPIRLGDTTITPSFTSSGIGYNLLVETGRFTYIVATEREGAEMRAFAAQVKPANSERDGVLFKHQERLLYLSEEMERLIGVPAIDYHTFEVVRVFNKSTRFELGRTYFPCLNAERPCISTDWDDELNQRREREVLKRWSETTVPDEEPVGPAGLR